MLRDPLSAKKFLRPSRGQKYLQNPKNLEPLDLPATVGPSCVGVNVCVCVKVSVLKNDVVVMCR